MSQILHRSSTFTPPLAVSGEGPYLIDEKGARYLDASGGAAVSCLGHGHPGVIAATKNQLDRLAYAHSSFFTNEPAEELAALLLEDAPERLNRVYFVSGGSEANETAMKLARQYMVERGEDQRHLFIAREQSYHGNTLGVLGLGGNPGRQKAFLPLLKNNHLISPCYSYRHQLEGESDEAYGQRAADALEEKLLQLGPENVVGFFAETVVGATSGVVPPAPGYFKRIRKICDRFGVLLILDEVMSGMGRTGYRYACTEDGVSPDILTCAKGLGGGYQPIGAVLLSHEIDNTIRSGSGAFQHGFTYIGHATACSAALAVQKIIDAEDLLSNVREQGDALRSQLAERLGQNNAVAPHIGEIRGRGLFVGLELVADRNSKTPFSPKLGLAKKIKTTGMGNHLICYPGSGTVNGNEGDHILLAPPFIIDSLQIEELVMKLEKTLSQVLETEA